MSCQNISFRRIQQQLKSQREDGVTCSAATPRRFRPITCFSALSTTDSSECHYRRSHDLKRSYLLAQLLSSVLLFHRHCKSWRWVASMPEPREPVLEGLADVYSGSDCITVSHDFSGPDAASICSQALPPIQREPPRAPPEPRPCRCAEEFRRRLTEGYHQENGAPWLLR